MAFMKFYQGSEAKAGSYLDGIYLATDTHKLFYKGIPYGIGNLENYALKADLNKYLPLTGGTLTGALYVKGNATTYPNFGLSGSGMAYYEKAGFARLFSIGYNSEGEVKYGVLGLSKDTTPLSGGNDLRITPDGVTIKSKTSSDILHAAGGTISINELKSQLGIPSLQSAVGNNNYTGANYVSKETNLTDAVLQLDEEIKAANDNLDLEHTNAEATYAKKTELSNYLPLTGGLMNGNIVFNEGKHILVKALSSNWNNNINNYISGLHFYDPTASIKLGGIGYYNMGNDGNSANNSWIGITANCRNLGSSDEWSDSEGDFLFKITATEGVYYNTHKLVDETQLEGYLTKTSASNTYQPKGSYLTSIPKASTASIGGIKVGNGLEIESDGTLNCTVQPGSSTVSWGNISGKPSVFSTNIASISDLHANWDSVLKATPASYVTRWPTIGEVTGKQNLVIKLNGGSTEGTNMFTFNGTGAKSINITPSSIGAAASNHNHTKSQISDFPTTWAWGNISGKPSFATVATSGSYNDLSNKPSIPSLSGYATQSWVNSQGFLKSSDLQILEVRSGSNLAYVELKSKEHSIKFRKDSYSITYDSETVFDFRTSFNQITNTVYTSLYPSLTYSRSSGISSNPFLSSKLTQRTCVPLNTILGNINYKIIAEPETISGLYLLSFSLYSGSQPTRACEIYSCLFTDITGEDLCRLEKAYPGIMNAMGTGNRFSLNGRNCKSLGKGYFMLDE